MDQVERTQGGTAGEPFTQAWTNETTLAALRSLMRVVGGTPWPEADLPEHPTDCALNIRSGYEAAAIRLSGTVPAARAASAWFYRETQAGALVLAAQRAMFDQGLGRDDWFYLAPYAYSLPLHLRGVHTLAS